MVLIIAAFSNYPQSFQSIIGATQIRRSMFSQVFAIAPVIYQWRVRDTERSCTPRPHDLRPSYRNSPSGHTRSWSRSATLEKLLKATTIVMARRVAGKMLRLLDE